MKFSKPLIALIFFCAPFTIAKAQYEIKPMEGYTPQIGLMVDMLEELKNRITESVHDLNLDQTDFLIDEKANSIGSLIMHLAATEAYYQTETLEERKLTKEEDDFWDVGSNLGDKSRAQHKGKPIKYYLDLWDEVRQKTLEGLKERDDAWFASNIDENMNIHWAWFHVLEHSANHMGQIALVKNRLPE